jgi:predicted metal-binding protein
MQGCIATKPKYIFTDITPKTSAGQMLNNTHSDAKSDKRLEATTESRLVAASFLLL